MPIYEYKCPRCENEFEELLALKEYSPLRVCPKCNMPSPRKISAAQLRSLSANERIARERNEKAVHEPLKVTRQHHCDHQECSHGKDGERKGAFQQIRKGARPWMLG